MARPTLEQRFWKKVNKTDGCWLWIGARIKGYGSIRCKEKKCGCVYAHRLSWELANQQQVPEGLGVLHRCDNPLCVNPDHLFVGTQAENMADMNAKGRQNPGRMPGAKNPQCKLHPDDALTVRWLRGMLTQAIIARFFGVTQSHVSHIQIGRIWSEV